MKNQTPTNRRAFLKGAAAAGGAATVGIAAGAAIAAEPEAGIAPDPAPARKGYRVTPHIERYYRLARD